MRRKRNWRKVLDVGDTSNVAPSPPANFLCGSSEASCPGAGPVCPGWQLSGTAQHLWRLSHRPISQFPERQGFLKLQLPGEGSIFLLEQLGVRRSSSAHSFVLIDKAPALQGRRDISHVLQLCLHARFQKRLVSFSSPTAQPPTQWTSIYLPGPQPEGLRGTLPTAEPHRLTPNPGKKPPVCL